MFHGEDILNASFTGASSPKYEIVSTNCEKDVKMKTDREIQVFEIFLHHQANPV